MNSTPSNDLDHFTTQASKYLAKATNIAREKGDLEYSVLLQKCLRHRATLLDQRGRSGADIACTARADIWRTMQSSMTILRCLQETLVMLSSSSPLNQLQ